MLLAWSSTRKMSEGELSLPPIPNAFHLLYAAYILPIEVTRPPLAGLPPNGQRMTRSRSSLAFTLFSEPLKERNHRVIVGRPIVCGFYLLLPPMSFSDCCS